MSKKIITSYTNIKTAEGERLSYTVSTIDDNGNLITSNERKNCIVFDEEALAHIEAIRKLLQDRELAVL
ncbi:hypothetical protein [Clostridium cellulovorans]|uniref:Peptide chain release factor 2 n=1 Tax=Clostridium cellulovorans (strain ATCC 35296 / DSM 3052 / OCM 3 / 743B) TaxID=573061 RepID=D9SPF9_CLOC7|nr:hypothetical protein [Clostridium cellulovorans]ADL50008.1 peptide chain release factor 2 [Clostridium cellulovorans 743B]